MISIRNERGDTTTESTDIKKDNKGILQTILRQKFKT